MDQPLPDAATIREVLGVAEALAREAGGVLMRHFRRIDTYEKKGAKDLVTVADRESEEAVLAGIRRMFPDHGILAEESGRTAVAGAEWLWVVDPLDGTTNFAHGVANFAVSIGVQHRGQTVAGVVFAPALGELYSAGRGRGATRNGHTITASKVDSLEDALLVTGFPYNRVVLLEWLMATFGSFLERAQGMVRLGAASLDLALVAAGNLDGFYEANLNPWDMAAGALLVEEAGGRMSTFDGGPFAIETKRMLASNGRIHEQMKAVLGRHAFPPEG